MTGVERKHYEKLVRDKIPDIIRATGATPKTRTLSDGEFLPAALAKVVEEAHELQGATPGGRLDELADLWEILSAVLDVEGLSWEDVTARATKKRDERGGFAARIWLEAVDDR